MNEFQLAYEDYVNDFDPTPQYADDDYGMMLEYEDWLYEKMDEIGLY